MNPTGLTRVLFILLTRFVIPGLFVGALVALVTWYPDYVAKRRPPLYSVEGKFERHYDFAAQQSGAAATVERVAAPRAEIGEQLKGYTAVERVVDDLELAKGPGFPRLPDGQPQPESNDQQPDPGLGPDRALSTFRLTPEGERRKRDLIKRICDNLQVHYQAQSDACDIIVVTYTGKDPREGARIVERAVENYVRRSEARLLDALTSTRDYFTKQKHDAQGKAQDLQDRKDKFETDYPHTNPADPAGLRARLATMQTELTRTRDDPNLKSREADLRVQVERFADYERNFRRLSAEYKNLAKDLDEAGQQVLYWDGKLKNVLLALQYTFGAKINRLLFTQRPDEEGQLVPVNPLNLPLAGIVALSTGGLTLLTQGIVNVAAVAAALRQRQLAPAKPAPESSPEPRDVAV